MSGTFVPNNNLSPKGDTSKSKQRIYPNVYEGYYWEGPSIILEDTRRLPRLAPPYCNPDDYFGSDSEPKPEASVITQATLPSEPERSLNPFPGWKGPEDDEFLVDL